MLILTYTILAWNILSAHSQSVLSEKPRNKAYKETYRESAQYALKVDQDSMLRNLYMYAKASLGPFRQSDISWQSLST